jgi:hypothetical protein
VLAVKISVITGTSRGFGRKWTIAALDRGRHRSRAALPIQLDVSMVEVFSAPAIRA